jgi:hypothetical protein
MWCCFLLVIATLTLSVQVELDYGAAVRLTYMLQSLRVLKDVPAATAEDVDQYYAAQLAEGAPLCPTRTPFWSCNEQGEIDEVTVRGDGSAAPVDFQLLSADAYFANTSWVLSDFVGSFADLVFYFGTRRVVGENLVLLRESGRGFISTAFPFLAQNLTLTNVTATEVAYKDESFQFAHCAFTNVTLRCPIPRFLLPCFNQSTPVCLSTNVTSTAVAPTSLCIRNGDPPCNVVCSNTPAPGYDCLKNSALAPRGYFPLNPGFSTLEFAFSGRSYTSSVQIKSVVLGLVNQVEAFDWKLRAWVTVFESPQGRRQQIAANAFELIHFDRSVLTNRVRFTVEQWYQSHAIASVIVFSSPWPEPARPFIPRLECEDATTQNARSMLDDTIADSLCIGRLCQPACDFAATSFTFQRTVKAQFLVIEGGNLWTGGQLATMTSDNTRVYKLDGRETSVVNVTGVGAFKRVRLVGDPVGVSLPAPTLPNRLGLPGVFVKTYRSTVPTGGVTLSVGDGGGLVAPNGTVVSVARVQNQTFAATDDGAIWQVNGTLWTALSGFTSLILNANEKAPARQLVSVGDRLVVVVAANIKVHDGSKDQLLVNRLVTQTPIDALDVQTGVWYNRLLDHDIAKNVSDVDVVRWNATAFAVVDRATREAAVFEWRPFPFALVKCTANTDCRACTTSEANEEPCRWCGPRCVSRQAICAPNENPVCVDPTTTTTTTTTATTTTTTTSTTSTTTTTPASITTSTTFSSLASPAESSDPLLPLYIVLGILGTLVLIAGGVIAVIKLRDLTSKPAAPNDVPMEEPKKPAAAAPAAVFDPDARYGELGDADPEDPRYGSL